MFSGQSILWEIASERAPRQPGSGMRDAVTQYVGYNPWVYSLPNDRL
jgi:hypothetical protein